MRILAIDGGGIRGCYSAHLLKRIHAEFQIDWVAHFDLIVGTSTGSIIAAGLAAGVSIDDIAKLYESNGAEIFRRKWWGLGGMLRARYDAKRLEELLAEVFGDRKLSETRTALALPSTDIGNGRVHVFKSSYDETFVRDKNVRLSDAVLASCAAPTFFNPRTVGNYLLADGGLWANNPSLLAIVEAQRRFKADIADIKVLSIGTGAERCAYSQRPSWLPASWGFLTKWGRGKLVELLLCLQSQTSANMSMLLLGDRYLRINFEGAGLSLDDTGSVKDLLARADADFTHQSERLRSFLAHSR